MALLASIVSSPRSISNSAWLPDQESQRGEAGRIEIGVGESKVGDGENVRLERIADAGLRKVALTVERSPSLYVQRSRLMSNSDFRDIQNVLHSCNSCFIRCAPKNVPRDQTCTFLMFLRKNTSEVTPITILY